MKGNLEGKEIYSPEMDYVTTRTIGAAISGMLKIKVNVLPTGAKSNLKLGNKFTSGKECYPYIQTASDILTFLIDRKEKGLGIEDVVLLMPQACGPCRFGQYIPALELILKETGFTNLQIVSPTTADAYTMGGLISKEKAQELRQVAWNALVFGDVLNRMWWRARPYEQEKGQADAVMEKSLDNLCGVIRQESQANTSLFAGYKPMLEELKKIGREFKQAINQNIPKKPLIGIVGEIYLRFHTHSNQNLVRELENQGCETVTASMAEWVNYLTFLNAYQAKQTASRRLRVGSFKEKINQEKRLEWLKYELTGTYQLATMHRAYHTVEPVIDIQRDHSTKEVMSHLGKDYTLDLPGEAVLSIASAKAFADLGYDGVVNCLPFGCMPSNNADEVLRPQFQARLFPYLSTSYDQTVHPSARQAIGIFAGTARRHLEARLGQAAK
jgi:predicted nucleotide-binding protein (sugar kinase/HSP70/actin superfamily)